MWRLIPNLPVALLLAVIVLWSYGTHTDGVRRGIVDLRLTSDAIPLIEGTRGAWALQWPEWPEKKGRPVLAARGLPYRNPGDTSPIELVVRVEPRGAATMGEARQPDGEGWFEAGVTYDWDTVARLDPRVATRIEYWVRRAPAEASGAARILITGENDSPMLEGILIGSGIRNVLALLAGLPLLLWSAIAFLRRRASSGGDPVERRGGSGSLA